ncbi:MAG: hypothetical protein K0S45_2354 [Nitrospira sp.]|jgi:Fe-S-cluster containining protein|nr:hypothetical protein [Nitrospira sp.]
MGARTSSHVPLPLFQQAEQWFQRAQAALLGAIPCRRGCCQCCTGTFPITQLDALELQLGLDTLPSMERDAIVTRARAQIATLETAYPVLRSRPGLDEWDDRTVDEVVERFSELPCPALTADGACGMYAFRPMTCRTMGIPIESDGLVQGPCAVQTAVPIIRLMPSLRIDEDRLAEDEAVSLSILRRAKSASGEELLLPYGFLPTHGFSP